MPIFEYLCERCGHRFDRIVRQPAEAETCPTCGGQARRAISLPAAPAPSSGSGGGCAARGGFS